VSIPSIRLEGLNSFLASKQLALGLFLVLCFSLIPGTFRESDFHASGLSRIILGCMALNLLVCTLQRIRTLSRPVLIMHAGVVVTMAGAVIGGLGFIATVQIYEGSSTDRVYRWDLEQDVLLGATLAVRGIDTEFYPVPIRVGVLRGQDKVGLFELKTGDRFALDAYTVRADSLNAPEEEVQLSIFRGERLLGTADTSGTRSLPADFPYDFKLVGYQDPVLKRVVVALSLSRGSEIIAEGTTEINSPFEWNGLYFYHTNLEQDDHGNPYAGIQIVKDPGRPVVYIGFALLTIGTLFWMYKKTYGHR
jgi:hypothetical protein